MITLKNLNKHYDTPTGTFAALQDINMHIPAGEIFGVIGKSGAGKSTLMRCINLLEKPSSGSVIINGQDLTQLSDKALRATRHNMGMIFQHFNLMSAKTVAANIALPLTLVQHDKTQIHKRVNELLDFVGLSDKANAYPNQLSGGQKQRVAIARALAAEPKILLCDEATSALDPQSTQSILELLETINQQLKLTILLITHEMSITKRICERVAVIDQGRFVEVAPTKKLFMHPESTCARELLSEFIQPKLPDIILQRLQETRDNNSAILMRMSFSDSTASEPIIAHIIKNLDIHLNILQGNMEYVQNESLGTLLIELPHDTEKLAQMRDYLHQKNIQTEVLGYVSPPI